MSGSEDEDEEAGSYTASAGQNAKHGWICTENSFLPFFSSLLIPKI